MLFVRAWRAAWGLNYPDPEVGQQWHSERMRNRFKVVKVEHLSFGRTIVSIVYFKATVQGAQPYQGISTIYTITLEEWRRSLRREKRKLMP